MPPAGKLSGKQIGWKQSCERRAYVWPELEIADAASDILVVWIIQMAVKNLLRERQRTIEPMSYSANLFYTSGDSQRDTPRAHNVQVVLDALVVNVRGGLQSRHGDFGVTNARRGGGKPSRETLCLLDGVRRPVGEVEHRRRR